MDRRRARSALERDLDRLRNQPTVAPRHGWIRTIRDAIGMSTSELAERIGVTKARISQIERGERERTITLDTLERAAAGLGCRLEYVLVPHETLDEMVERQAVLKATAEIDAVDHTMALEDQRPDADAREARIAAAAAHHLDRRGLWA